MQVLKKIAKYSFRVLLIGFITLCLLEVVYRFQLIDFYSKEWNYHAENLKKENCNKKLLVFGDSFSADPQSWVYHLSDSLKDVSIYNASLPGVGPETFRLIFNNRVKEVNPDVIIVQLYIGNDLYDMHKPMNWSQFSMSRNIFWTLGNRFRVLNFVNYRLGQSYADVAAEIDPKVQDSFEEGKYSLRTKMYIHGNPNYPCQTIDLSKQLKSSFDELIDCVKEMKENAPLNCSFKVLLLPHCTQVNQYYIDNFKKLSAQFPEGWEGSNAWSERIKLANIDVINPLDYFKKLEANEKRLFFDNDPHLKADAQQLLADYIKMELVK